MTNEDKNKNELTPAEDNPLANFALETMRLDKKSNQKNGLSWLIAINRMHLIQPKFSNFDLEQIQKMLPDNHRFKKIKVTADDASKELIGALLELNDKLKDIDPINEICFSNLKFDKSVDFSNFIFPVDVTFSRSTFSAQADFQGTAFSADANFSNTTFSDEVHFNYSQFCGDAIFQNTTFFKHANFFTVIFSGTTYFYNAKFTNDASFSETIFSSVVFFHYVKFLGNVNDFKDTTFSSITAFHNAEFFGITYFHNAKFLKYTTFEETKFEKHAPQFYGAEINDEMFWTGIKLPKFEMADDKETKKNYKKRIESNQNAYENLSTKLGNQNKYRDEHFFFRQEMSCQRELAESYTSGIAFWLYGTFSDYGYRIGRAFWCWLGHIALGAVVIAFIAMCGGMRFHESLPCAIPVSFANANPYVFFGFESSSLKECYKILEPLAPISFAIVKAIQTVLGIALLFLVVLTLRVRFRLK